MKDDKIIKVSDNLIQPEEETGEEYKRTISCLHCGKDIKIERQEEEEKKESRFMEVIKEYVDIVRNGNDGYLWTTVSDPEHWDILQPMAGYNNRITVWCDPDSNYVRVAEYNQDGNSITIFEGDI